MMNQVRNLWRILKARGDRKTRGSVSPGVDRSRVGVTPELELAPDDPIFAYFRSAGGAVDIDKLDLDSPALQAMKAAGIKMVVPLVSQGELIGLLNLGPRRS